LRAHEINVVVDNGKSKLTGKVDENVNKDLAQQEVAPFCCPVPAPAG
jgi:osmotically-inducible protein OsmY